MPPNATRLRGLYRRLMPDRVTLTYREQTAPGVYATGASVADCWYRPAGTAEAGPSAGVYLAGRRAWHLPKDRQAGPPMPGDLLVSPTSAIDPVAYTWTVLSTTEAGALGVWACECVSLQLRATLRDTLTLLRPANTTDGAGGRVPAFADLVTGIPARVQETTAAAADRLGKRQLPRTFTATVGVRLAPRALDRVRDQAGRVFTVTGFDAPDRLDEFMALSLELVL